MKVAWVTGDYPPEVVSGTSDGSYMLTNALRSQGVEVEVITGKQWGIANAPEYARQILQVKPDIVHMEYPTASYGSGLAPQILSLSIPMVVRIHEVSHVHIFRRLSLFPFSIRSRKIIFTTHYEREYASRFVPWVHKRSCVIPIWSQIPAVPQPQECRRPDIVYFGLFRRKKGIEQIIELAELIKQQKLPLTVRLVGIPDFQQMDYYERLRSYTEGLPIIWDVGLEAEEVASLLGGSQLSYMPFPDGASERRGSLLALLANGVAVVTTIGKHTPPEINGIVRFASSPKQALQVILELYNDTRCRADISAKAIDYANNFSLDSIANEYAKLYWKLLNGHQ